MNSQVVAKAAALDRPLRRDVRLLALQLAQVLRRHGSPSTLERMAELRRLARQYAHGDQAALETLTRQLADCEPQAFDALIRTLLVHFDLTNIAEDRHRIRVLRARERAAYPKPRDESIGAAIRKLAHAGVPAATVRDLLARLHIEPVFTAHPTEAKRKTVRATLRRVHEDLAQLDRPDLLPRERRDLLQHIEADIDCLWETESLRDEKPTVMDEVRRSLTVTQTVWDAAARLVHDLRDAVAESYPGEDILVQPFLRLASWVGGDRDGNPFVTPGVTRQTLIVLRQEGLLRHRRTCEELFQILTISESYHPVSDALSNALRKVRTRWPQLWVHVNGIDRHARYRQWLAIIRQRLLATAQVEPGRHGPSTAYDSPDELAADVQLIQDSLRQNGHHNLADQTVQSWLDRIAMFGFSVMRLDVREDSRLLGSAARAIAQRFTKADPPAEDDPAWAHFLATPIDAEQAAGVDLTDLEPDARKTLDLFELLADTAATFDNQALGCLVISMTHRAADVLAVLWLSRLAALRRGYADAPALPIVPLFETISDLERGGDILDALLTEPAYREHLQRHGSVQVCMIGYSDSTKDGGYLAANWNLYEGQRRVQLTAAKHGVPVMFFHGRGGSIGRGGGPAARGIQALPPGSVDGRIRMTEQGEVLAERYDDPAIAYRHLEQVASATLLASALPGDTPPAAWTDSLQRASTRSQQTYRALLADPHFVSYFRQATPISVIEALPIGSRPSRRRSQNTLADLRAIPYTFAWTQNRQVLTGFFGLGTGLSQALENSDPCPLLREMYERWPLFRATMDNAELAMIRFDPQIARLYASLAEPTDAADRICDTIEAEYRVSHEMLKAVTGQDALLSRVPWLQRAFGRRIPDVDLLNLAQIELTRRRGDAQARGDSDQEATLTRLLRQTVQAIAAGMRTTG